MDVEKVTQADREAAASVVEWQRGTGWEPQFFHPLLADGMRQAKWDDHDLVQAFARHRLAALEASGVREAIGQVHPRPQIQSGDTYSMRLGDYLREDGLKRLAVGFLIGCGVVVVVALFRSAGL